MSRIGMFGAACGLSLAALAAVPRPWTPVEAKDDAVSVIGRTYAFDKSALPASVKVAGEEILAGPMRVVVADNDGQKFPWTKGGSWVVEKNDESATYACWQESELAIVDAVVKAEFDGLLDVTMTVLYGKTQRLRPISRVWLEIPLKPQYAKFFANYPRVWGKVENAGSVTKAVAWPFKPYVWLGDEARGLCWFAESDETFLPAEPRREIEVIPGEKETVLRIRFADRTPKAVPMVWRFGLQATPVKPFDRSWNRNHVLQQVRVMGEDGKREHVWKTLLRPDAVARFVPELDKAKAAGVKTVVFHEDWIRIQNCPKPSPSFKDVVTACHDRGLKVLVYQGYEISALDPLWAKYHDKAVSRDWEEIPRGLWYRQPGQRDPTVCYKSGFAEDWLARAKKAYDDLGIDGYYLDGTICAEGCTNGKHGCGWRDANGRLHETYPFFAYRKMMRALYEFVDGRGGVVNAHQSGYVCPATLAFCHAYWDGEHVALGGDARKDLDTGAFCAEFMGRNHGVACEFLTAEQPGKWTYANALALALLHDVLPRPNGCDALDKVAPVWKPLDDFGWTEAAWTPYWQKPLDVAPASVKASVYRRDGKVLAVVSNLGGDAAKATVAVPAGLSKVVDARTGESLVVSDGKVAFPVEPFTGRLLRME